MGFGGVSREELVRLGKESTAREKADGDGLGQGWADEKVRLRMFAHFGFQKPAYYLRPTPRNCRKWLKRLGMDVSCYTSATGFSSLGEFAALNPHVPPWAWLGQTCGRRLEETGAYCGFFGLEPADGAFGVRPYAGGDS